MRSRLARDSFAPLLGGLLVGGASRRFGRPKALEPLQDRAFAEHVAAALAPLVEQLTLLGDGPVPAALERLPRLADAQVAGAQIGGPMGGLLAALEHRPDAAWLVAACDQPFFTTAAGAWLLGARRPGTLATLARLEGGRIEPFPGLYEPASAAVLRRLATDSGGSFQPLAGREDVRVVAVPAEHRSAFADLDRPTG